MNDNIQHEYLVEGNLDESLVVRQIQILTMSCDINKESKQAGIHQTFPPPNIRAIQ